MKRIWLLSIALLAIAAMEFGALGAASAGASFVPGWLASSKEKPAELREGKRTPTPVSPPSQPPCQPDREHGRSTACDREPASIQLTPDPLVIECNGYDRSTLTVRITDAKGHAVTDGTLVSFWAYNGIAMPAGTQTKNGIASTSVAFYGDMFAPGPNLNVAAGPLEAGVRIRCFPQSDGPNCPPSPPPSSPPSPSCPPPATPPSPPPCSPSPPSSSPPCATPTPPAPPCSISPPSVSPPCATPTPTPPPPTPTPSRPTPTPPPLSANTFIVDADATTAGIQPSITVPVGGTFTISSILASAPDPYQAYQSNIALDPSLLVALGKTRHPLGETTICGPNYNPPSLPLYDGCISPSSTLQTETGNTVDYTLLCVAPGTSTLHLLPDAEIGIATGTNFALAGGYVASATTIDASVTCFGSGPVPCWSSPPSFSPPCATWTPTPVGGPITMTPTPSPTPTGGSGVVPIATCLPPLACNTFTPTPSAIPFG